MVGHPFTTRSRPVYSVIHSYPLFDRIWPRTVLEGKSCEAGVPPACADEVGPQRSSFCDPKLPLFTYSSASAAPASSLLCAGHAQQFGRCKSSGQPDGGDLPIQAVTPDSGRIRTVVILAEPLAVEAATGSNS